MFNLWFTNVSTRYSSDLWGMRGWLGHLVKSCKCIHKTFIFVHVESVIFTLLHRNLLKLPPQWIMQLTRGSKLSIVCAFKKMDHFDVTSPRSIERAIYNYSVVQHSMSYAWRCTYSGTLTKTYGALRLVQFGCYQHWYEWKGLWCSNTVRLLSTQT